MTQIKKEFLRQRGIKKVIVIVLVLGLFGIEKSSSKTDSSAFRIFAKAQEFVDSHEYQAALNQYIKARKVFIKGHNFEYAAYCNTGVGAVYESTGNYALAYEHHQKAYALLDDLKNENGRGKVSFRIGRTLWRMKRYDESNLAYREAIRLTDGKRFHAASFNNMGINYRELNQLDSAVYYHKKSIGINRDLNRPGKIAKALSNLGKIEYLQGAYESAVQYYLQAEEIQKNELDTLSLFKLYNRFGETYIEMGQYQEALDYLLKGNVINFNDGEEIVKNRELVAKAHDFIIYQKLEANVKDLNIKVIFLLLLWFASILLVVIHIYRQRIHNTRLSRNIYKVKVESLLNKIEVTSGYLEWVNTLLGQAGYFVRTHNHSEAVSNVGEAQKIISDLTRVNLSELQADKTKLRLKSRKN